MTSLVAGTSCPALQFIVEGVVMRTTAATIFENATCNDIQPGMKVEAKAARQTDGSFVASRINIEEEGSKARAASRASLAAPRVPRCSSWLKA